ncbi:hypothetical protein [Leptospira haakeii]|uniref:Serine protease n=1 Tax=Leptospira haakeii TaxID=2023198 RepID=A0ABX4PJX2_9LEPT|nr:hypothetical protein [Leptospira haakeii]PKA14344.1 hypothetical protein CH363_19290 [Leptospira haakeii]PKA18202.1 hypothetical protein CH377_19045 [Leptospira haakeii]
MEEIFQSIFPIIISKKGIPEQIASGVLLKIQEELFILTSAHVYDGINGNGLLVPTKTGLIEIEYFASHIPDAKNDRKNDKIDIAYLRFKAGSPIEFVDGLAPLSLNQIDISDSREGEDIYTFTGFPYRKSKFYDNKLSSELYSFTGGASNEEIFVEQNYDKNINIIIDFNRKKTIGEVGSISAAPLPNGISGGGIFSYSKDKRKLFSDEKVIRLVGIAHTFLEKEKLLVGTSIKLYLNLIFSNNPHLITDLDKEAGPAIMLFPIPYYKREQWTLIKDKMEDKDVLHPTWDEWRIDAENYLDTLASENKLYLRIEFDVNQFIDYCKDKNLPLVGRSRIQFISAKLANIIFEK